MVLFSALEDGLRTVEDSLSLGRVCGSSSSLTFNTAQSSGWRPHEPLSLSGNNYSQPLRIAVPSVTSSQQTEEWDISQLRGWLHDILDKKPTTDEAVDQIVSLLTQFEVPWSEHGIGVKGEREEATGKNMIMQRFLSKKPGSSSVLTSADSGFASADSSRGSRVPYPYPYPFPNSQHVDTLEPLQPLFNAPSQTSGLPWPMLGTSQSIPMAYGHEWFHSPPPPEQPLAPGVHADTDMVSLTERREVATETPQTDSGDDHMSLEESSSPESSQVTDAEFYSFVLSNEQIRRVNDGLLRIFGQFIHSRLGLRTAQHHGAGSSSGPGTSDFIGVNSMSSDNAANNAARNRRKRRQEEDDGAPGDGPGDGDPGSKRRKEDSASKPKIACPFMKRSPTSFSTWRTCVGPGFDGLHRMK